MIFKVEWNLNEKKIGSYNWHYTIIEELINVRESNLTSILDMNENNFILKDLVWMVYLVYVNTKKCIGAYNIIYLYISGLFVSSNPQISSCL